MKIITFKEYQCYKNNEESFSDIFNKAWKNSNQFKDNKKYDKNIFKASAYSALLIVALVYSTRLASDLTSLLMMKKLEGTLLLTKVQDLINFFNYTSQASNAPSDINKLISLLKSNLSASEIKELIRATKGIDYREAISFILSL